MDQKNQVGIWKKRNHFPLIQKIEGYQFDAKKLLSDYEKLAATLSYDGLRAEYDGLCKTHDKLPQFFLKDGEVPNQKASYSQLALSKWDDNYSLNSRLEKSGTLWDRVYPKNTCFADERFYRKPIDGLPVYLAHVLNEFRPYLHRCRFAKLNPNSEVLPHIDYDTTYGIRLHIAIKTNQQCTNGGVDKNGTRKDLHIPADGSVWFINQGVKHWAKNDGDSERVHLIMSLDTQKFIKPKQ